MINACRKVLLTGVCVFFPFKHGLERAVQPLHSLRLQTKVWGALREAKMCGADFIVLSSANISLPV